MTQSIPNKTIHTSKTSDTSDNKPNISDEQQSQRSFCVRIASIIFMVIPHIVTHIGSGAAKGIDVGGAGATGAAEFLFHYANKTGGPHSKRRKCCIVASVFVGAIVGVVAVVPSLLIGAVVGIAKSIYKFPAAVKTCWGDGVSTALRKTVSSYKINIIHIQTAGSIVAFTLLAAVVVGLILLLKYVAIPILLFSLGVTYCAMRSNAANKLEEEAANKLKKQKALMLDENKKDEALKVEKPYKTKEPKEPEKLWEERKKSEEKLPSALNILNTIAMTRMYTRQLNCCCD